MSNQQKFNDAIPLIGKAAEIDRQLFGEADLAYLDCLDDLAWIYCLSGDLKKGEPLLQTILEQRQKVLGLEHPDVGLVDSQLAWVLALEAQYPQAQSLFRRAAEIYRNAQGPFGRTYVQCLSGLAETDMRANDYRRAEALRLEILAIHRRTMGESNPALASDLRDLSLTYRFLLDFDKAERFLHQALNILKENGKEKDLDYVRCLADLAYLDRETGKYDKALPLCLETLQLQKQLFGADSGEVGLTLWHIASNYKSLKDYAKALEYQRQAVDVYRRSAGETDPDYKRSLSEVGVLLESLGREAQERGDFAGARRDYQEEIEAKIKLRGEKHWDVDDARLLLAFVDQLEKMPPAQRKDLFHADERLQQAVESVWSKPRDALPKAEQALEIYRRLLGEEHFKTLDCAHLGCGGLR